MADLLIEVICEEIPARMQPRAMAEVASRSPKYPSEQGLVGASTRISPSRSCSMATCTIQLSPGGADMVTADPATPISC